MILTRNTLDASCLAEGDHCKVNCYSMVSYMWMCATVVFYGDMKQLFIWSKLMFDFNKKHNRIHVYLCVHITIGDTNVYICRLRNIYMHLRAYITKIYQIWT